MNYHSSEYIRSSTGMFASMPSSTEDTQTITDKRHIDHFNVLA